MSILADLASELGIDPEVLSSALTEGGEAESLVPTYLSTSPDGSVSATFSGHVKATGIDLQGGQGGDNQIRWLRASDGALLASIYGYDQTGTDVPSIEMDANRADGHIYSSIIARLNQTSLVGEVVAYEDQQGIHRIIDGNQFSSFLQLLGLPAKARIAFGTSLVNIANGTNNGSSNIPHGLGAIPAVAWANARTNPPLSVSGAKVNATDATNVTVQAYTANLAAVSASINITCDWFAIG